MYWYKQEWRMSLVDSQRFFDRSHVNPPLFPCGSETFTNQVRLGKFKLTPDQVEKLSEFKLYHLSDDIASEISHFSADLMKAKAFAPLLPSQVSKGVLKSRYMKFTPEDGEKTHDCVGDVRMYWRYVPCEVVTVMAQQMEDEAHEFTFRPWNP